MKKKVLVLEKCFECPHNRGNFCAKENRGIDIHKDITKTEGFPPWCTLPNYFFESEFITSDSL